MRNYLIDSLPPPREASPPTGGRGGRKRIAAFFPPKGGRGRHERAVLPPSQDWGGHRRGSPAAPWADGSRSRGRRAAAPRRGKLTAALFFLTIACLSALTLVFQRLEGSLSDNLWRAADGVYGVDPGFGNFSGLLEEMLSGEGATTIPRAPSGLGVRMSVTEERGRKLSATEIYRKVLPSVVAVNAYSNSGMSSGSGVILSADGYIITNCHVIHGSREAEVVLLSTGEVKSARLVGAYADLDVAVLKIEAGGLTPAQFGSSRSLEAGETVYAIGNPMGYLYGSITDGIVSAVDRTIAIGGSSMRVIQTSAALNSGNSGGALVNAWGQVVGITSAKIDPPSTVTTEGLGLALPISDVRRCVNTLLRTGRMENPAIGILCRDWPEGGVLVVELEEDSPALAAGVRPEDVILAADGIPVHGVEELKDVFYDLGVGARVRLAVLRGGAELELSLTLCGN